METVYYTCHTFAIQSNSARSVEISVITAKNLDFPRKVREVTKLRLNRRPGQDARRDPHHGAQHPGNEVVDTPWDFDLSEIYVI